MMCMNIGGLVACDTNEAGISLLDSRFFKRSG